MFIKINNLVVVNMSLECKDNFLKFLVFYKLIMIKCFKFFKMISIGIVIMIIGLFEKLIKLFLKRVNFVLLNVEIEVNKFKNRFLFMLNFGINDKYR